ncbi:hypothetical protein GCM10009678_45550 [Actinomadura kijaniata]|uniref:YtxH domain-containing protein n=1 Tax=Actinomadura namibiensis TaxID=182080 RepID=A0A7W3LKF6_ACTNM|nr:YtxH domain-containing protein [Actinomadura namibiensis]MBA8949790.1 hypothetical protein [Actinomadura namibiensis]
MKIRTPFIAGAAVGYVLGTRAGRERYEQMTRMTRKVMENPRVQETTGVLYAKGGEIAGVARDRAGEVASAAWHRVPDQIGERIPGKGRRVPEEYQDPRREASAKPY